MKKIAFIDHSYHIKTKSSFFMLRFLEQFYQVDLILNDQWETGKELDLSSIAGKYDIVIFWQLISPELIAQTGCSQIVFFPMYDDSGGMPDNYWHKLSGVKIFSFSKTLHERLQRLGLNSFYLQYYPQVKEEAVSFFADEEIRVFFWARKNEISWPMVKQLLAGNQNIKQVHIHASADPGQTFEKPSEEDEKKYHITYSEWFETREEYMDIVSACNVYIAPRLFEGIGFSFLEAMSMGKAVIAADHPTMNEYIIHGVNGYLFSEHAPAPLDLSHVSAVCKNAFYGVLAGRRQWLSGKKGIPAWIEIPLPRMPEKMVVNMDDPSAWKSWKEEIKTYTPAVILKIYRFVKRKFI